MRQEEHEKALPVPVHALRTTPMGAERIRKNLSLGEQDAVSWCREQLRRTRFSCGREKTGMSMGRAVSSP